MIRDALETTTAAAAQTDRWLFIAALVALGIFAMFVMRYFVKQHEQLIADHKVARDSYQQSLLTIVHEQSKTTGQLSEIIRRNTEALNRINA